VVGGFCLPIGPDCAASVFTNCSLYARMFARLARTGSEAKANVSAHSSTLLYAYIAGVKYSA